MEVVYLPPKNPKRPESLCQNCRKAYANKCEFIAAIFPGEVEKNLEGKKYVVYSHTYAAKEKRKKLEYKTYKILDCPDYVAENKNQVKKAV